MLSSPFEFTNLKACALRAGVAAATAAGLLLTSGCGSLPSTVNADVVPTAQRAGQLKKNKVEEPQPIPVTLPTIGAFRGDGIYYFNDRQQSHFWIDDAIAQNGLYSVKETFKKGEAHGFTWGAGAAAILRGGQEVASDGILGIEVADDHHAILHFKSENAKRNLKLHVKLDAYDMSGLPIGPYLRTRTDRVTPAGYLIGGKFTFPQGSLGYRATMWIDAEEVIVPTKSAFTGSSTIEDFSKRFSKDIPYCLRYMPDKKAEPLGLVFEEPIVKKTERVKGKVVEKAQSGEAELYAVKKGTIFCAKGDDGKKVGEVSWRLRYVNGSRVLELSFPDDLKPANYGIHPKHRNALHVALAEMKTQEKGKKAISKLVPARIWLANTQIQDQQWRFNKTAATAIEKAIASTAKERQAWDEAHQTKRNQKK